MNISTIQKHYDKLTMNERFSLLVAAGMRGDDQERDALLSSAPRKVFSFPNTYGLSDAFELAAMWHVMTMLGLDAHLYFLLSLDDDDDVSKIDDILKDAVSKIDSLKDAEFSSMDLMYKIQHDILLNCEAWRVVCAEYGIDPVKILQELPNSELIGLLEATVKAYNKDDPIELCGLDEAVNLMRAVIESKRKQWE